jgi:hypothetical protein
MKQIVPIDLTSRSEPDLEGFMKFQNSLNQGDFISGDLEGAGGKAEIRSSAATGVEKAGTD